MLNGLGVRPRVVVRPLAEVHRTAVDIATLHRLDRSQQQIGGNQFGARMNSSKDSSAMTEKNASCPGSSPASITSFTKQIGTPACWLPFASNQKLGNNAPYSGSIAP